MKDFPALNFQALVGKTIASIQDAPDTDEGLEIDFTDGTNLCFGFSGCEGSVIISRKIRPDANGCRH